MKRKVIKIILGVLVLTLFWFLFIKKYDYQVNFDVKTSPGLVYNKILVFKKWHVSQSDKNIKTFKKNLFKSVDQKVLLKDSTYLLHWKIEPLNDSITKVRVYIKDKQNSIKQRLLMLIGKSEFINAAESRIALFAEAINQHSEMFRTKIIGKSTRPAYQSIIYVTFSTDLRHKANEMMKNIYFLTNYMRKNKVKKVGNPFMNVTHWNIKNDSIVAEFCFPVENLKYYPNDTIVKIKKYIQAVPAIKAIYNGNYMFSDDGWFALLNYARINNISIKNSVFEIYYNDPHDDGNQRKWKADVFIPTINKPK